MVKLVGDFCPGGGGQACTGFLHGDKEFWEFFSLGRDKICLPMKGSNIRTETYVR
jgi:hypothetical protein